MSERSRRILLIDDSEVTLDVGSEFLSRQGYDVKTAASVNDIGSVIGSWEPDIILTDVNMPDIDGPELCRRIKSSITRLVPVILFSDLPDSELSRLARRCGADGYLSKSHGLDSLTERIEDLCGSILW